jgi:hypothetical protein
VYALDANGNCTSDACGNGSPDAASIETCGCDTGYFFVAALRPACRLLQIRYADSGRFVPTPPTTSSYGGLRAMVYPATVIGLVLVLLLVSMLPPVSKR